MWDVLPSRMHSRGTTAIPHGPAKVSRQRKKEGRRGLQGEFLGRGLAGILCSLVHAGFPVIGGHQAYRWWVDRHGWGGAYLGFLPFLAFPLLSSPFLFLSSPPVLLQAVQLHHQGRPGVSSGACLPGHHCSTALAC